MYTLHFALSICTLHSTLYTPHFTLGTAYSKLHNPHFTLYTLHSPLNTPLSSHSTPSSTFHSVYSALRRNRGKNARLFNWLVSQECFTWLHSGFYMLHLVSGNLGLRGSRYAFRTHGIRWLKGSRFLADSATFLALVQLGPWPDRSWAPVVGWKNLGLCWGTQPLYQRTEHFKSNRGSK